MMMMMMMIIMMIMTERPRSAPIYDTEDTAASAPPTPSATPTPATPRTQGGLKTVIHIR